MLKISKEEKDFIFILENLRFEDFQELNALWGDNWKNKTLESLRETEVLVLYGKDEKRSIAPIAMGGFYELLGYEPKIACVWLLSTKYIKYNKSTLMKVLKDQIKNAENKYNIMYNFIYSANFQAKTWLCKLGFRFDNPKPSNLIVEENFEFFYKVVNRKEF